MAGWGNGQGARHFHFSGWCGRHGRYGTSTLWLAAVALAHGAVGLALVQRLGTPPEPLPVTVFAVAWLAPTPAAGLAEPAPAAPPAPLAVQAPASEPPPAAVPVPLISSPAPVAAARPAPVRQVKARVPAKRKVAEPKSRPRQSKVLRPARPVESKPRPAGPAVPAAARAEPATGAARAQAPAARSAGPATQPSFHAGYLRNPAPAYPEAARRRGEQGRVLLRVQVSPAGLPQSIGIQSASGSSALDRAALAAVQRWRFVPARQGGRAVTGTVLVPLSFSLRR